MEISITLSPDYVVHRENPAIVIEGYKDFYYKSPAIGVRNLQTFRHKENSEEYNHLLIFCDKMAEEVRSLVKYKVL